jgi:hypothetical protein
MSVLMTFRVAGDPARLEQYASENPDTMRAVRDRAAEHGLTYHRFYGSDDGTVLVVDEWPSQEDFQKFFEASPEIGEMMQEAGASGEPEVTFWRKLETHDDYPE